MKPGVVAPPEKHRGRTALLVAAAAGLYASAFYVAGNATMLTPASAALVAAGLTLPPVILVVVVDFLLARSGYGRHSAFAAAFLSVAWLLFVLRLSVFQGDLAVALRERLPAAAWLPVQALYLLVPSALAGLAFRRAPGRLSAILAVMTLAAAGMGFRAASDGDLGPRTESAVVNARLDRRPDIYFLLADSFGSVAYLQANGIHLTGFRAALIGQGFRFYDDTFSNYHATADSMLSMLDMRHHYYRASRKLSEVSRTARRAVGGENNLTQALRANGYRVDYIHQGNYLLLQGCSADACFPDSGATAGAAEIFRRILPSFLVGSSKWDQRPFTDVRARVFASAPAGGMPRQPTFRYVHLYEPSHASNNVVGRCDEAVELAAYAANVKEATTDIVSLVDEILRRDPGAVIVVSGDHGPLMANHCGRDVDISTPAEYRDRTGVLTAIRWPAGYDGRFDAAIRTNVNLFRYLLASLQDGSHDAVGGRLRDDVFVHGSDGVLKILDDGRLLQPPERLTAEELRALYDADTGPGR